VDASTAVWLVVGGLATGVGGLGLYVFGHPSDRVLDMLLGFTGGVMLAATAFSLLVPALDRGSLAEVVAGFLAGVALLAVLDVVVPHVHARFREPGHEPDPTGARALLLVSALTIHNVPEGLAVGVAFAAGGSELGIPVAIAIAVQNVPEGFAAAAPVLAGGASRRKALGVAAATGAVEPPAAFLAYAAASAAAAVLPFGLAFAAGAMLYVVVDELIPESHAHGFEREATYALAAGFTVMMFLDNVFG
jgi:ZIP family zinc transporter